MSFEFHSILAPDELQKEKLCHENIRKGKFLIFKLEEAAGKYLTFTLLHPEAKKKLLTLDVFKLHTVNI